MIQNGIQYGKVGTRRMIINNPGFMPAQGRKSLKIIVQELNLMEIQKLEKLNMLEKQIFDQKNGQKLEEFFILHLVKMHKNIGWLKI